MYHSTLECDPMVLSYIQEHRLNTAFSVASFIVVLQVVSTVAVTGVFILDQVLASLYTIT